MSNDKLTGLVSPEFASMIENSNNYYKVNFHKRHCRICSFPFHEVEKINKMILDGTTKDIIATYICNELYPLEDYDIKAMKRTISMHADYLPYLVSDAQMKGIFAKARHIAADINFDDDDAKEKAKKITEIEKILVEEVEDMTQAQLSIYNCLYKETIPLLLNRLTIEILTGKATDIKHITMASDIILRMTNVLKVTQDTDISKDVIEEHEVNKDDKKNIINLAERIKDAMGEE